MGLFTSDDSLRACDETRLMIVDDEAPIRQIFQIILSTALPGVAIEQACNGLEAVRLFKETRHGLVLMDLRMPEMDGLQAFRAMQEFCSREKLRMPSVVFCTGYMPPDAVNEIVAESNRHCLLHKPVQSDRLIEEVRVRLKAKGA